MNKVLQIFIKALIILVGGLTLVALFWLIYLGLTLLLESTIYQENPQDLPQDHLRSISTLLASILTLVLLTSKLHEILKSIILLAGVAVFMIALILYLNTNMWLALTLVVLISGIIIWIINRRGKTWIYYFALGVGVIIALIYAWPI